MPIKGLSDRDRLLPRLGKIHLGVKDPERKGAPRATEYFVFPEEHPQFKELIAMFGDKPDLLRVVFPVDEEDRVASQYYRCYSRSRGLVCKGDGASCRRLLDKQTGALADADSKQVEWRDLECQGRDCTDYTARCKEVMNLQFMLPEITGLGIWQIDTSSINSILNINASFDMIKAIYGRISMVPLFLTLEPKEVTPEGGTKKTVRVLNVRSPDTLQDAARRAILKPVELMAGQGAIALPVPDDEPPQGGPDWEPQGEPTRVMTAEEIETAKRELWPQPERKPEDDLPEMVSEEATAEETPDSQAEDPNRKITEDELAGLRTLLQDIYVKKNATAADKKKQLLAAYGGVAQWCRDNSIDLPERNPSKKANLADLTYGEHEKLLQVIDQNGLKVEGHEA